MQMQWGESAYIGWTYAPFHALPVVSGPHLYLQCRPRAWCAFIWAGSGSLLGDFTYDELRWARSGREAHELWREAEASLREAHNLHPAVDVAYLLASLYCAAGRMQQVSCKCMTCLPRSCSGALLRRAQNPCNVKVINGTPREACPCKSPVECCGRRSMWQPS